MFAESSTNSLKSIRDWFVRRGLLLAIWIALAVLLIIPCNVVEQIVSDRHVLLGRYSRTQFYWICGLLLIGLIGFYIDLGKGAEYKRRWFRVLAMVIALTPGLLLIDFFLRTPARLHYVRDSLAYRHLPHFSANAPYVDAPLAARTYPHAPAGYPTIERTLRTDARGFRNAATLERAEIVTLGDSFTEGSGVSDEHAWPVLLEQLSGKTVCNLGMSGYAPLNYLASLRQFGVSLRPKLVICMLFEGNDFRSARTDEGSVQPGFGERVSTYFKQSPLLGSIDPMMMRWFGNIRARSEVRGGEMIDWMPVRFPRNELARYYAFAPKQLRDRLKSADDFSTDNKWLATRKIIGDMHELCRSNGAELVIVYAPTVAHVLIPEVMNDVPSEKLRAFTAFSVDEDRLPEASRLASVLIERADGAESVVREFCERERISFVSLTRELRRTMIEGRQAYFTYDQHWTPVGHEVAARVIVGSLGTVPEFASANGG